MSTARAQAAGRHQRGQAMTEYLAIGVFFIVAIAGVALEPSPIIELLASIKKFFAAYSYAISITP